MVAKMATMFGDVTAPPPIKYTSCCREDKISKIINIATKQKPKGDSINPLPPLCTVVCKSKG